MSSNEYSKICLESSTTQLFKTLLNIKNINEQETLQILWALQTRYISFQDWESYFCKNNQVPGVIFVPLLLLCVKHTNWVANNVPLEWWETVDDITLSIVKTSINEESSLALKLQSLI